MLDALFKLLGGGAEAAGGVAKAVGDYQMVKLLATPGGSGGVFLIVVSAFLAWKITQWHRDPGDKFDVTDLRYVTVPVLDLGLFGVGVMLLFW